MTASSSHNPQSLRKPPNMTCNAASSVSQHPFTSKQRLQCISHQIFHNKNPYQRTQWVLWRRSSRCRRNELRYPCSLVGMCWPSWFWLCRIHRAIGYLVAQERHFALCRISSERGIQLSNHDLDGGVCLWHRSTDELWNLISIDLPTDGAPIDFWSPIGSGSSTGKSLSIPLQPTADAVS